MEILFPKYLRNSSFIIIIFIILYFNIAGGRTKDEIIQWVLKKSGPAATVLQSEEEFKSFIEGKHVAVVGFFENLESDAAKLFSELADSVDDHPFGLVSDYSKFSDLEHKDTFVLYKDVSFKILICYFLLKYYLLTYVDFNFSLMKRKLHLIKIFLMLKTSKDLFLFIRCLPL